MLVKLREKHWSGTDRVDVVDGDCLFRPCFQVGEDKGSYTPGVGYTRYWNKPRIVCWTRHLHGCPYPKPEPDAELARCCPAPDFARPRKRVSRQRCRLCGTWHSGTSLELVRALPTLPHVKCRHAVVKVDWLDGSVWHCPQCDLWWDTEPRSFAVGEDQETFRQRRFENWKRKFEFEEVD